MPIKKNIRNIAAPSPKLQKQQSVTQQNKEMGSVID